MILTYLHKKITPILKDAPNVEYTFNQLYSNVVNSLDYKEISCDNCGHNEWRNHAYYFRYVVVFSEKIKIKITRIICTICGKTHAILIEPMLPFLYSLFDDLVEIITYSQLLLVSYQCFYLKRKFSSCNLDYLSVVHFNARNLPIIVITT